MRITLQNHGPAAAHVRINSADDSGKNFSKDVQIAPDASTPVALTFSFANPGFHWAQAWVEGDAATAANRAELGFWTTDVQKAIFVGGKDDFAAMPYAISPGGNSDLSGIDAIFTGAGPTGGEPRGQAARRGGDLGKWPQDGATSQALQDYVRQGGTLFLVPAPDSGTAIAKPSAVWLDASRGHIDHAQGRGAGDALAGRRLALARPARFGRTAQARPARASSNTGPSRPAPIGKP